MTGDPKVLAGLQQAFNASENVHTQRAIASAWEHETDGWSVVMPTVEQRIRAWTPTTAGPSLEQRVAELTKSVMWLHELFSPNGKIRQELNGIAERIDALEQHPEPTEPDLDPVRVEAAAKAAYECNNWHPSLDQRSEKARANIVMFAHDAIWSYLKDGGA